MKKIEITEIPQYIDAAPVNMCLMFIGDTGIGKTQVIKKYAEDNDIYLKTIILSQIEASEALGIPVQSKRIVNGREVPTIDTAVPSWVFDLAEHENAMLYLDEFLCAEPSVMNSFLNFLTEKNVNGIDLSHVKVVAATNIGNYTYEPDNNILSRFCMFYAENTSYNKYLKGKYGKKYFDNDYVDTEDLDGTIFDQRSLKPRCQEMLMMLKNEDLIEDFYEGYTNQMMMPKFSNDTKVNAILKGFVQKNENGYFYIDHDQIENLAGILFRKFSNSRAKNLVTKLSEFKNVQYDSYALKSRINDLINARDQF